jgi:hypothetical protein
VQARRSTTAAALLAAALASGCWGPDLAELGKCVDVYPWWDDDPCTADACDPATGEVTHAAVAVDDGDACTTDACDPATGEATHVPVEVPVGEACTVGVCDPATGEISWTAAPVDDGDACTADACDPGTGEVSHTPIPADDGIACTIDSCDPASGALHQPDDALCAPGETCDPASGCLPPPTVLVCQMQFPIKITVTAGEVTPAVIGWFWVVGVTDALGPGPGLVAEVGYGAPGTDPALGWTWFPSAYYKDERGAYDAYRGAMTAPATGTYEYLYRVTLDGGASYTYCDLLGILDPGAPEPGRLTVTP